ERGGGGGGGGGGLGDGGRRRRGGLGRGDGPATGGDERPADEDDRPEEAGQWRQAHRQTPEPGARPAHSPANSIRSHAQGSCSLTQPAAPGVPEVGRAGGRGTVAGAG